MTEADHQGYTIYSEEQNNSQLGNIEDSLQEPSILRHTILWTCVLIIAYVSIFLVGIVGNVMVVCFLVTKRRVKRATDIFRLNLATSDISVVIFCVFPTLLSNIFVPWLLGSFMCKAVAFVQGVSVCASVYSLVAISLDRFLVIMFPLKWPRGFSKNQARWIIVCIWTSASIIISPWLIAFTAVTSGREDEDFCLESWPQSMNSQLYFLIGNLLICYTLPLIVIIICNVIIWLLVERRKVPEDSASPAAIEKVHRRTSQGVFRILCVITFTFLISWLPLYLIALRLKFGGPLTEEMQNVVSIAMPFAQWLGVFNSCINPLLYTFINQKYKDYCCCSITYTSTFISVWNHANTLFTFCLHCALLRPNQPDGQRTVRRSNLAGCINHM